MKQNAQNFRRRPGTIEEMRPVCQWSENQDGELAPTGSLYNRYILRPISIYVTWLFIAIGIRAHAATVMMTIVGLAGIVCCVPHAMALTLVGGIFYFLFDLLDAVDGEIARWNKTSSTKGLYLDQVSHVFVDYPSRAVPALHYCLWKQDEFYVVLAVAALTSSLMGRAFREIFMRINAEIMTEQEKDQTGEFAAQATRMTFFHSLCTHLKASRLAMFPIVKPRVVHIITLLAIFSAYSGFEGFLIFVSWFYAIYCTARMFFEIPYYYSRRVVDVAHKKTGKKNNWPI
jgi:phosphatidylglycerophosphate synthase